MAEMRRAERLVDDLLTLAQLDEGGVGPSLRGGASRPLPPRARRARDTAAVEVGGLPEGTDPHRPRPDRPGRSATCSPTPAPCRARRAGRALGAGPTGRLLVVSVDDDGPGVPPEERERVFDRFHRSEASRDRAAAAAASGLGIARSIVELHGGRIWIEDSPLGGARRRFELPGFRPAERFLTDPLGDGKRPGPSIPCRVSIQAKPRDP